jgi:predicted transcriptional regulator
MLIKNRTVEDMNKRMKNMSQEIRSGKQLQENLPKFFNYMADRYQTYASVRLAMHYYTFYEACLEEENAWSGEAKAVTADISGIMTHCILARCSGEDREKAVYKIDSLRNEIGKRMNILTAYTDIFQIYEYVLNRLEYRFGEELEPMDEEEFAREILRYIFDGEDNLIINEKIREIIGQLPVRITRQKYLDLLEESLQVYLGAS